MLAIKPQPNDWIEVEEFADAEARGPEVRAEEKQPRKPSSSATGKSASAEEKSTAIAGTAPTKSLSVTTLGLGMLLLAILAVIVAFLLQ